MVQPEPIRLEVIEAKPAPEPAPVAEPAPVPEPTPVQARPLRRLLERLSPASLYNEWKVLAGPLYALPTLSIPKETAPAVECVDCQNSGVDGNSGRPMLRFLAESCAEETFILAMSCTWY